MRSVVDIIEALRERLSANNDKEIPISREDAEELVRYFDNVDEARDFFNV